MRIAGDIQVLERQYSSLFTADSKAGSQLANGTGSTEGARPLDASIREDQHIPRRRYTSLADFDAAGRAAGYCSDLFRGRGAQELRGLMFGL